MGELIKKYGEINIKGKVFDVELNGPVTDEYGGIIHIQNEDIRLELTQGDFYSMVGAFALAKRELELMKGKQE